MKQKKKKKWIKQLKAHLVIAKGIVGLRDWKIEIRLAQKEDFIVFRKDKKTFKHLKNASLFLGLLEYCDAHKKQASIVINPKEIKDRVDLYDTLFHELLHIQVRRVGRGYRSLPIDGEERLVSRLSYMIINLLDLN